MTSRILEPQSGSGPRQSAAASAADAEPLSLAELSSLLAAIGGFETRPRIAVAVSGGPDSLALALLAAAWAKQHGGAAAGLVVDHRLRPESAAEARIAAGWLAARGIAHAILCWAGDKPSTGVQAAARVARYELLAGWCRANGVLHLFVAHHREDQAETFLIRQRAKSGADGLAAMSAVRELAGCRLVRPLLAIPRARLAAVLAAAGQPFLRDPSNLNPAFERARLRRQGDPDTAGVLAEIRRHAAARIAREAARDRLIGHAVLLHAAGFAVLDPEALKACGDAPAEGLLARVASLVGGRHYPPRRTRLARLLADLRSAPGRARTLGGCRFTPWRGRILVLRELAAAEPPVSVVPGARLLWDRRFAVVAAAPLASPLTLGYLGQSGAPHRPRRSIGPALPPLVHAVLPALWDDNGLVAVPHAGYRRQGVTALPELAFSSANGAAHAGFTVV